MKQIQRTDVSVLREEATEPEFSVSSPGSKSVTVEASGLQSVLDTVAGSMKDVAFKCVECGLNHSHATGKHRASDTFNISEDDAGSNMDFNSVCHCGVNELAHHGSDFGVDEAQASSISRNAPIPDDSARHMASHYS